MDFRPKLALVGVKNILGKSLKLALEKGKWEIGEVYLYEPGIREYALIDSFRDEAKVVKAPKEEELAHRDLVFFTVPVEDSLFFAPKVSVDLSGTRQELPFYVEGINENKIRERRLANPHPAAVGLSLILSSLQGLLSFASSTVIEPVSSVGEEAMDELFSQAVSLLNMEEVPKKILGEVLAFDIFPKRGRRGKGGFTLEELRVSSQVEGLIGAKHRCLMFRAGIFHRYAALLYLEVSRKMGLREMKEALEDNRYILLESNPISPMKIEEEEGYFIYVGEIKKAEEGRFWLWAVFDNLQRASVLNALSIGFRALRYHEESS